MKLRDLASFLAVLTFGGFTTWAMFKFLGVSVGKNTGTNLIIFAAMVTILNAIREKGQP